MEKRREVLVDALRGVAVLAVLLGHAIQRRFFRLIIPTIVWSYLIYFVR